VKQGLSHDSRNVASISGIGLRNYNDEMTTRLSNDVVQT